MHRGKKFDLILLLPVLILIILGTAVIGSVAPLNIGSQLLFLLISIVVFTILLFVDIDVLFPFSAVIYFFMMVLLLLPLFFGAVTRGSTRWIPLGFFNFQPSETIKPFFVLFSAWFWLKRKGTIKNILIYAAVFLPAFLLIFIQPDLGSALVLLSVFSGMVLLSGISIKNLIIIIGIVLLLTPVFWLTLKSYQKDRIVSLLNPQSDPFGKGYNVIQAKIAIGSGGFFGRGLGKGTQSHLAFLPERHTDFVISSLGEELGFWGILLVLSCYVVLFWRILFIAGRNNNREYFLISMGIFFYMFFQTGVNIGMNFGLMPVTGIPLPFLSYGGSSLLTTMISLSLLESVYAHQQEKKLFIIGG